ncbi:lytic transglycosylase domain-containing protein [Prevotella sp.]
MSRKRYIVSFLVTMGATYGLYAQQQTVVDSRGKAVSVMIPDASETMAGYVGVDYIDDKFYNSGIQTGFKNTPSTNTTESENGMEVINRKMRNLSNVMTMTCNEEVKKYIDRYTKAGRQSTSYLLGRARYYNPIFEEALRFYGLPLELKYLPVIESGLNPNATSRVGAAGLWQFMATTGKQYDLQIDSYIDERRDPEKSSYAAARMLSDLYKRFGDWTLALAAYNCGPGRVSSAITKAGGGADFWAVYRHLPKETRGYVPAFIAANYVMNYYADYDITPLSTGLPNRCDTIIVEKDVTLAKIANVLGMNVDDLKVLNPQYRQGLIKAYATNGVAKLRLPSEMIEKFKDFKDQIYQNETPNEEPNMTIAATNTSQEAILY